MDEHAIIQASLVAAGLNLNANGGFYRPGVEKTFEEKLGVARIYLSLMEKDPETASIRKLALEAKCSRNFASKIIQELTTDGGGIVIDPKTKPKRKSGGVGSRTFSMNLMVLISNPAGFAHSRRWHYFGRKCRHCQRRLPWPLRSGRGRIGVGSTILRWN